MSIWMQCIGVVRLHLNGMEFEGQNDLRAARTKVARINNLIRKELNKHYIGDQWLDSTCKIKLSFYNRAKYYDGKRDYSGVLVQIYINQRHMMADHFAKVILPSVTKKLLRSHHCWISRYQLWIDDGISQFKLGE